MIHLTTLSSRNGVMTTLMFLTGESGEELVGYSLVILILRRVKLVSEVCFKLCKHHFAILHPNSQETLQGLVYRGTEAMAATKERQASD